MKALLIRVGIDSTYGQWNAPVNPESGEFVYVPIPEDNHLNPPQWEKPYTLVEETLEVFSRHHCPEAAQKPLLPARLQGRRMHLDPDFEHLTYGDKPPRGNRIRELTSGDLAVFYAGLRSIHPADNELVYALIGLYVVEEVVGVCEVEEARRHENAHTRRATLDASHHLIRARKHVSGRLEKCLPIGTRRKSCYFVREELLAEWGGLSVKDGYISRSAVLPWFLSPERFYAWFQRQNVGLLQRNNPSISVESERL